MRSGIEKAFALGQAKVLSNLLPDICQIQPTKGGVVTYQNGIPQSTVPSLRSYNGSTDIPCRVDISRAFRPVELKQEATETVEYNLELPFDIEIETDDKIIIDGTNYIIRKLSTDGAYDVSRQAIISRLGKDVIT